MRNFKIRAINPSGINGKPFYAGTLENCGIVLHFGFETDDTGVIKKSLSITTESKLPKNHNSTWDEYFNYIKKQKLVIK